MADSSRTLRGLLEGHRGSSRPAIVAPSRPDLSFAGLVQFTAQVAGELAGRGITPRHRVAAVLPNGPEAATGFLTIASCAAYAPLNPGYSQKDFEFYLEDLRADALVVDATCPSAAVAAAASYGVPVLSAEPDPAAAGRFRLTGSSVPAEPRSRASGDQESPALLLHTSGTTSRPKLVPLLPRNLCASAENIARTLQLNPADRCLNIMPLFHIHGLMAAVLASLSAGASVVCTDGVYAARFLDWLVEFRPTWFTAVPTMHQAILARAAERRDIAAGAKLRLMRSSSAALAPQVLDAMEQIFGAPLVESYGMTEAAHQMASNPLPPAVRKPGSVGPAAGPEIAVMDEAGNLLEPGTAGEVVIRGANVTPGYENNPEANAAAFTAGWFRTGDRGYLDGDGYLHLTGRLKELINRGGEKISPREIDEVVLQHPGVRQALSFAVPHVQLGEEVAVAVELTPGAAVTETELRHFAAGRLPAFKAPKLVRVLDEIPKGPTGKLQRIGLAAKLGIAPMDDLAARAVYVAPRNEEERLVAELWRELLAVGEVGALDTFESLGGDSLLVVRAVVEANRRFRLEGPFLRFLEMRTVAAMAEDIREARLHPERVPEMILLHAEGEGPPLYCVPGHDGVLLGLRRLAGLLDGPPMWTFPLPADLPSARVPELGTTLAARIDRLQPRGALRLAGVCFGGLVAFEAASRLQSRGREVELLAMIDTLNPAWRRSAPGLRVAHAFARLSSLRWQSHRSILAAMTVGERIRYLGSRLRALQESLSDAGAVRLRSISASIRAAPPDSASKPRHVYREAQSRYTPAVAYDGRTLLIEMEGRRLPAPLLGWEGLLTGEVTVTRIPFDAGGALSEKSARAVAEHLQKEIQTFHL